MDAVNSGDRDRKRIWYLSLNYTQVLWQ